ncbi:hypothetical protein [Morganella morganii]|uniref:hypothetical protein n=1 Tax=Morganella morganii TaxID=582 RepID=UPI0013C8F68B|nr:hypothetical protein [Morganella morganii]NGE93547.1 hypothetical protein [Morganella morganii]
MKEKLLHATGIINGFFNFINGQKILLIKSDSSKVAYYFDCVGHFYWVANFNYQYTHFFIFQTFFDLLDIYCENRFKMNDTNFCQRYQEVRRSVRQDNIEDLFISELYDIAKDWRNGIVHHDYKIENNEVVLTTRKGKKPQVKKIHFRYFKLMNELIYQLVTCGVVSKSLYGINAKYSGFLILLDKFYPHRQSKLRILLANDCNFTKIKFPDYRWHRHFSLNISEDESVILNTEGVKRESLDFEIYEADSEIRILVTAEGERISCPLTINNTVYTLTNNGMTYLFPSEVIINNPDIKLKDMNKWILNESA